MKMMTLIEMTERFIDMTPEHFAQALGMMIFLVYFSQIFMIPLSFLCMWIAKKIRQKKRKKYE